jgi:hypothetical protein
VHGLYFAVRKLHIVGMEISKPIGTFRDLGEQGLEIHVVCQRCGHEAVLDAASPSLRDRRLAGQRFRCTQVLANGLPCGGVGLPSIDRPANGGHGLKPSRHWPDRLANHARKLGEKR